MFTQDLIYSFLGILNEMSPYILLGFLIAGLLHAFVSDATMSRQLAGRGWKPVVKAALFGIPLPLCSCGVLPTAVAMHRHGASKGATTSFLIATPQTGVDSIAATYSLLGLPFAIIRPIAALAGAFIGGMAVDKFDGASEVAAQDDKSAAERRQTFGGKIVEALRYGFVDMVSGMAKWLVLGLVIASLITVLVPDSFFVGLSEYPLLAMLAVVAVAVPMYVCATGSIPIALSLIMKGLSPGIAFVMLMAGPAANFASIMILKRATGSRATAIYIGSVVATAIGFGLLIHYLMPASWFVLPDGFHGSDCHHGAGWLETISTIILVGLLLYSAAKSINDKYFSKKDKTEDMDKIREFKIGGMACAHCKANVERHLCALEGMEKVEVDLGNGTARVEGTTSDDVIIEEIRKAGYEYLP